MQFWGMILCLEDGGSAGLGVLHGGILVWFFCTDYDFLVFIKTT